MFCRRMALIPTVAGVAVQATVVVGVDVPWRESIGFP